MNHLAQHGPQDLDDKLISIITKIRENERQRSGFTNDVYLAQIHQAYNECGYLYFTEIPAKPLMAGEEWYKRFEQICEEDKMRYQDNADYYIGAAKRASGL